MKVRTICRFMAVVAVAIAPSLAAGDSVSASAEGRLAFEHGDSYAQRIPRLPRLRESVETEMQQTDAGGDRVGAAAGKAITIDSGFVIFKGRYVPPPYAVRSARGTVYINGLKVQQRRPGPFSRRPVNMPPPSRGPQNRGPAQIERHLREDGLLICTPSNPPAFVSGYQAVSVLEILLGDESSDLKVQKLVQTNTPWIASNQWASLTETFDAPAGLADRVVALKQGQAELGEDDTDYEPPWLFISGITFAGFVLAVWALGTLIRCRPPALEIPRPAVLSKGSCRQVIWLVVLFAVLNMYDLTCTLFATSVGGLWELNPLASPIMHQNSMVVAFKLGLTIGPAILFLVARRNRLAHVGSWWAGVLYTVLILRWTTFNSMFL